jgi:rhamnose utilization protein RhaD (predicted bifunctional aldolase and dehydrogenase)
MSNDYIYLSHKYGSRLDWYQAGGGNISVKEDNRLFVKKSGTAVCDADFVLCDLDILNEVFNDSEEHLSEVTLSQGTPSIEVWFHTFTKKYTVHLHPTELCSLLCQPLTFVPNSPHSSLVIPYVKPGKRLAQMIKPLYQDEPIIYLLNHGVLFTSDSLEELDQIIGTILDDQTLFLPNGIVWKTQYNIQTQQIRPFTPDILIYLGHEIVAFEKIEEYKEKYQTEPKLLSYKDTLYVYTKTKKQYYDILEVWTMYLELQKYATHTIEDPSELLNWDREQYRQKV